MSLVLNGEQAMLRDSALQFLNDNAPPAQLRRLRDGQHDAGAADGFARPLWREFAAMGFTGVLVPEDDGGLGLGMVEAGAIMEAVGHNLSAVPYLATAVLGATFLARHGSPEQRARLLPPLAAGTHLVALAVDEAPRHRPQRQCLRARPDGAGFSLSGAKTFVVDGHVADTLIVAARTDGADEDDDGVTLFLVDAGAPGVRRERTVMVDAHNAARIVFDGVHVAADAVLGTVGAGRALLDGALDAGRVALAAELLGIADEAAGRTLNYLKERRQFGRIIGEFQALQHRAADLYCEIEVTRAAVLGACRALDLGSPDAPALASVAKARAGATAARAVQEAVQMHGGIGMTDELDIGLFMKRARVVDELFGDARFHADRWARLNGY